MYSFFCWGNLNFQVYGLESKESRFLGQCHGGAVTYLESSSFPRSCRSAAQSSDRQFLSKTVCGREDLTSVQNLNEQKQWPATYLQTSALQAFSSNPRSGIQLPGVWRGLLQGSRESLAIMFRLLSASCSSFWKHLWGGQGKWLSR